MIKTLTPTKTGFDVAIEVRDRIFNLKNVKEESGFVHIDIHDTEGEFFDEFCSGFPILHSSNTFELDAVKVFEYIDENLLF